MYVSDNHIIGIGNAIVDVLAPVPPATIDRHGLTLAAMHLIDSEAADLLYAEVEPEVQQSGGSVANTIAHIGETAMPAPLSARSLMTSSVRPSGPT